MACTRERARPKRNLRAWRSPLSAALLAYTAGSTPSTAATREAMSALT